MGHRRCSRDGEHHPAAMEGPGQRELRDGRAVALRDFVELSAGLRELAGRDGEPGDEGDVVLLAIFEHIFVLPLAYVVLVLHANDVDDLAYSLDLVRLHFAETYVADFALLLKFCDGGEGFFDGNLRVDAMELPEV